MINWSSSGSSTEKECKIPWSTKCETPGSGSFHPKLAGRQEFATLVNGRLAGTGPTHRGAVRE